MAKRPKEPQAAHAVRHYVCNDCGDCHIILADEDFNEFAICVISPEVLELMARETRDNAKKLAEFKARGGAKVINLKLVKDNGEPAA